MDPRLFEAVQKGDVSLLNDLIRSNARILEEATLQGDGNTPLHVACVAGHSNFVRELLKLMPALAEKVNPDGFSPLHIAATKGDVETVREILKAGRPQHLCLVKGGEGRTPLHCAVANGEVGAMKELLSASPESVEGTTAREETALHLAVKNNRFYALFVLVEHLKQHNKEQVINWKDKKGNTVLHLAAAAKNFEVVDFLLSGHALKREVMEVNALNESGSTPLDVSSDHEIGEILMRAGAQHGQSNLPPSQVKGQKSPKGERNDLLVVAGLIATAAFQVVIQPITLFSKKDPNYDGLLETYFVYTTGPVSAHLTLGCFLTINTVGFFLAVLMILRISVDLQYKELLMYSTYSLAGTYVSCLWSVPSRSLREDHYSPLGDLLINCLATIIPVLLFAWERKQVARILELQNSGKTLLPCLGPGAPQGNANPMQSPN